MLYGTDIQNSLQLKSLLSQMYPLRNFQPHLPKIRSLLSPLTPGLQSGFFPSDRPTKASYEFLISPLHATCLAHLILDFIGGDYQL
jgi:hypothetical protein